MEIILVATNIIVIIGLGLLSIYLRIYVNKKAENLATKEDVQEITKLAESMKASINSRLHVNQTRYNKEYELLHELTEKIVSLKNKTLSLRPTVDFANAKAKEEKGERLKEFYEANRQLYLIMENNRPFYPEKIYKKLAEISNISWKEKTQFTRGYQGDDIKYWEEAEKNSEDIIKHTDEAIDLIRERVEEWEKPFE